MDAKASGKPKVVSCEERISNLIGFGSGLGDGREGR
jgi:hypothetical protein